MKWTDKTIFSGNSTLGLYLLSLPKRLVRTLRNPLHLQTAAFWAAAFTTSFTAVLFTQMFKYSETFFNILYQAHPLGIWIWTPLCFVGSWYLVWKYAPEASGSGIPQVLAAKEPDIGPKGNWVDRLLSLRVILVKMGSAILGVAGGAAIGREGPTLQIGASIYRLFHRWTKKRVPESARDLWIIAGASTGLAAAFNTPLGGIVFAIEELHLSSFQKFRTVLLSSIIVGGMVSQWIIGPYLYLGMPPIEKPNFLVFPFALLVGILGGLLGAAFGRLLGFLLRKKGDGRNFNRGLAWALACGFAVVGLAAFNAQATGSGSGIMSNLLFHGGASDASTFAARFGSMTASYLAGGSGGIFAPSLTAGACLGSWLGVLFHGVSSNLMILLGMIAFLTGVTRTPFTAFVLVLEMTDRHSAIFPMMVAALAAEVAARYVQRVSFYERMKDLILESAELKAAPPQDPSPTPK